MFNILVLEDDTLFSQSLEDFLSEEGFNVDIAKNGHEALDLNYEKKYDLYLFDINVPLLNGLDLLKSLRDAGDITPTIFLTSYKDKETLQKGFTLGADDYLKKPVDMDELILRMKSLLKRSGKQMKDINLFDTLVYKADIKRLFKDGVDLNLSVKILQLLELFLEHRNKIVSKEMIVSKLWNLDEEYSEGSIRVYINKLKKILGKERIINIKGIGYKVEF